jgi:ABC-2 type transport system ATP-binding protein
LEIGAGEAVACVGPNGAGKSTTIKMLTGILVPTSGELLIDGLVPHKHRMQHTRKIGVVFGQRTHLWWDLPVVESLKLLKSIYDIPDSIYRDNMDIFNDLLNLKDLLPVSVRRLSLGQRMRADLAAAFLHNPALVFLDEPTIGLDVAVKDVIRRFIREINRKRGTTILLTSHDLGDIEDLCDRMVILDQGHIVYDGDLQVVKEAFSYKRELRLKLKQPVQEADQGLNLEIAELELDWLNPYALYIQFDRRQASATEVIQKLVDHYDVADFELRESSIEHILKQVYNGELDLNKLTKSV